MVREILYTVTENTKEITPATKQWAGMQYEDNATEVIFDLSALKEKLENPLYRVDFNSSSAGYQPSENLDIRDNKISRKLPLAITQYGGEVQITAVITETNDNGEETGVLYSYPVTVYFTAVKKSAIGESKVVANISAMEESIKNLEKSAKASVEEIIDYSKYEMGAEWIFDGGNSEDNLNLDIIVDRQMSDESTNPVMNKVAKDYIDKMLPIKGTEIVNNGDDTYTKWTFSKFPDGTFIAECSEVTEDSYETSQTGALYKSPNIVVSLPSFTLSVLSVYQNCTFTGAYSWGAAWIGQVRPEPKINYTVFALEKLDNIVDAEKRKIRKYLRITGTWK